ncbi:PfaD family polyunsaturated fatty acid/polyketide biosynthesis protein [Desulforegula conservatrix]|uniref:PfaD family polyunsaturated fatty acid/polyketide biosynthesis protein n=1 Tax=Desulforegula conservatrix TaxID=153026 RepID=UPI0003F78881|nr:PfaD family polyunsaturated fatty acid/polyketide biosynthesis protein [Desulforegula conservatrix]
MNNQSQCTGCWNQGKGNIENISEAMKKHLISVFNPILIVKNNNELFIANKGKLVLEEGQIKPEKSLEALAWVPPLPPESLGDPDFKKKHGVKYAYVAGAMAGGITSVEMVREMGKAGMLGFFGSAGLSIEAIENAINKLQSGDKNIPYGFNLIHSPGEAGLEMETVKLYLRKGVTKICAAAFMNMTPSIVYFRIKGIHRDQSGTVIVPNSVFAKVSRVEVAEKFFSPPPEKILMQLVEEKLITQMEADLASEIPVAEDLTAEADSGGHTDNRPAIALFPTIIALKDKMQKKYGYKTQLRAGLAGGVATPESAAAAFAMGAAYILTGSVNQACIESGTSDVVREMLAAAGQADVIMAPSADMFELGVKVQVLKRGTMFAQRAGKLYELYRSFDSFEDIPEDQQKMIEEKYFKCSFNEAWKSTSDFFSKRDPRQNERAAKDPKHKMALVFRSYLGQSSKWAIAGDPSRKIDYQIWCGPSMGAFNEWAAGSYLEPYQNRKVALVAKNLLLGASFVTRGIWLKSQGIPVSQDMIRFSPMTEEELASYF